MYSDAVKATHTLRLTLNLLTTTIVAPPSNASKWQMGFNSAFKGLMCAVSLDHCLCQQNTHTHTLTNTCVCVSVCVCVCVCVCIHECIRTNISLKDLNWGGFFKGSGGWGGTRNRK